MARSSTWLSRRRQRTEGFDPRVRVLTASARKLDLKSQQQAREMRIFRQGWQSDAWSHRDAIGELRYAINFLANCAARMRLYPAALPQSGETDDPVPIDDVEDMPQEIKTLCTEAIRDLGHGKLALKGIMKSLSSNWSVAGEGYLLGMQDADTAEETWTIRSVDEIVIRDDKYQLREVPSDPHGVVPWIDLDPDTMVLTRLWAPHPRYRLLADSPMRAMLEDCESLLILRRGIRATGRSRLAGPGILKVPDGLSIKVPTDDNDDPLADPFMEALANAMMTPITDEGSSSAVVPIVVRGPAEALKELQRLEMWSAFGEQDAKIREELIGIIATSFDLPKEVVQGVVDLNHWSAWQVDDNTFRHHVEPHVIELCDTLSAAFLRPYLEEFGADVADIEMWIKRCVLWYDPTELVTHPDQTKDALDLHDRFAISDEALVRIAGFTEEDRPSKAEVQIRLIEKLRNWPPNLVMAFLHQWDPTLVVPSMTGPPALPGIGPGGTTVPEEVEAADGAPPGRPELPSGNGNGTQPAVPAPEHAPVPTGDRPMPAPPSVTASSTSELDDVFAKADGTYGDMWVNDDEKKIGISFGDWEGELAEEAVPLVEALLPGYSIDSETEQGDPSQHSEYDEETKETVTTEVPGWRTVYQKGKRVGELEDAPVTAAAPRARAATTRSHKLSRRLMLIDRELRARLQVACNHAMLQQLERAGDRLRSRTAKDEQARHLIANRPRWQVAAALGTERVMALGLSPDDLLGKEWSGLRAKFYDWTGAAQKQALETALRLAELDSEADAAVRASKALAESLDAAWGVLAESMTHLSQALLYEPEPGVEPADWASINPDTIVPTGIVRAALGIAGGAPAEDLAKDPGGIRDVSLGAPVGQVGTGETITTLVEGAGGERQAYEWIHGPSTRPFEPHLDLDGVQFANFDDDALSNAEGWPENAFFMPGDHQGCLCDFLPLYLSPSEAGGSESEDAQPEAG
jgi:hypothetical protein